MLSLKDSLNCPLRVDLRCFMYCFTHCADFTYTSGVTNVTNICYSTNCSMLYWFRAGMARENLEKFRQVKKKKKQRIKRDLNPLHSVQHTRVPTTTPPLLPIIISPYHRQTLETNPANHWQPIPNPPPSPSHPYRA